MLNKNVFAFGLLSNRLACVILSVLIHEIILNPLSTQGCLLLQAVSPCHVTVMKVHCLAWLLSKFVQHEQMLFLPVGTIIETQNRLGWKRTSPVSQFDLITQHPFHQCIFDVFVSITPQPGQQLRAQGSTRFCFSEEEAEDFIQN